MKQSKPRVRKRRRRVLQFAGFATVGGLLGAARGDDESADEGSYVVEQDDRCLSITPLSGSEPVEDFYDYTYPARYGGPPGSDGDTFSSEGTTALQRDRTSILFLYDGPEGLSLVIVHGHVSGERDAGGTVTFTLEDLPTDAEWIVRDDYYLEDGEPADSNFDRWDVDGDVHTVDWAYTGSRTDGGALRGLGTDFDITLDPAFNDEAALAPDHDFGPVEAWDLLSSDRDEPDRYPLRLDRPVTIRQGTCETDGDDGKDGGREDDETDADREDDETDADREKDDEETKHQKKQRKHEKEQRKHEKKQRKHEEKHQKKQRKHREKHQKKQRKHREKHQKKQRKHG